MACTAVLIAPSESSQPPLIPSARCTINGIDIHVKQQRHDRPSSRLSAFLKSASDCIPIITAIICQCWRISTLRFTSWVVSAATATAATDGEHVQQPTAARVCRTACPRRLSAEWLACSLGTVRGDERCNCSNGNAVWPVCCSGWSRLYEPECMLPYHSLYPLLEADHLHAVGFPTFACHASLTLLQRLKFLRHQQASSRSFPMAA